MGKSRYLDISSANRDRTIYPNPFEFEVSNGLSIVSNPKYISDCVSEQAPYDGDGSQFPPGGFLPTVLPTPHSADTNLFLLNSSASSVQGSYLGEYIEIFSATSAGSAPFDVNNGYVGTFKVLDYNTTTHVITFDGFVNKAIYTGNSCYYYFRHQNWPSYSFIIKSATNTSVTIGEVVQNPDSFVGLWLQPTDFSPEMWYDSKRIVRVSVDTVLNTTTFYITASPSPLLSPADNGIFRFPPGFGNPPNTMRINILGVINNVQPLIYSGTLIGNQHKRCYHLDLCDFIISGTTAVTGELGGALSTYPYIYMEFQSLTQKNSQILVSNNQYSKPALFKISTSSDMITTFFNLRSPTSQTILFNPNDSFYIRIFKPNGETLQWVTADNAPPNEPNRFLQINFTIRMTPVGKDMCIE